MAEKLTYFDFAENDYNSIKKAYDAGIIGNLICSNAQKICERYLKHILDKYAKNVPEHIMKSHSLRTLKKTIQEKVSDFQCDWGVVMLADGYYFTTTYPNDDAFFSDEEDTAECMKAMEAVRSAVVNYMKENQTKVTSEDITENPFVQMTLESLRSENTAFSNQQQVPPL